MARPRRSPEELRTIGEVIRIAMHYPDAPEWDRIVMPFYDRICKPIGRGGDVAEAHPYWVYEPHPKQALFHSATADSRWACANSRGGKTYSGAIEYLRYQSLVPPRWFVEKERRHLLAGLRWSRYNAPYQGWIVTPNEAQRKKASAFVLSEVLPDEFVARDAKGRRHESTRDGAVIQFKLFNGSDSEFKSADTSHQAFEGSKMDVIWMDEEPEGEITATELIFTACMTRLPDRDGIFIGTATPLESAKRGFNTYFAQRCYLPWKAGEHNPRNLFIVQWSIEDNTKLTPQAKQRLLDESEKWPPWMRAVRLHGEIVEANAAPYFDIDQLNAMEKGCAKQGERGRLVVIEEAIAA